LINSKNHIKQIITSVLWVLVAVGCITLLVSAMYNKEAKKCAGVQISIEGVNDNYFIDKNDIYAIVKKYGGDSLNQNELQKINLKNIENELGKNIWIKKAILFFDNNNILKILVEEREPIARIFNTNGNSFYIDSTCKILPLSNKFSARLPLVTGFTGSATNLSKLDSALLMSIKNITTAIYADTFLNALIEQIDVLPNHHFEMIPKVGNQIIYFGNADDVQTKFKSLKLFYKKVIPVSGFNKYSKINLQFKNQVVTTIKGATDVTADSLRTLALIQAIADNAAMKAGDTSQTFLPDVSRNRLDSSSIEQSAEREDEAQVNDNVTTNVAPTVPLINKPTIEKKTIAKPVVVKPIVTKNNAKATDIKKPIVKPSTTKSVLPKPGAQKPTAQKPVVLKPPKPKPKVDKPNNDF
jgi:cell division protein FtsQ